MALHSDPFERVGHKLRTQIGLGRLLATSASLKTTTVSTLSKTFLCPAIWEQTKHMYAKPLYKLRYKPYLQIGSNFITVILQKLLSTLQTHHR
jgi:hypothetical protein